MAKKKSSAHAEKNYKPANRRNLDLDKPTSHGGWPEGDYHPEVRSQVYDYLDDMGLIESILTRLLAEQKVLAIGQCFPFTIEKAEEWFEDHYTPPDDPEDGGVKHPDLDNTDKFKVVHGKVTDKWKKPPKHIVHAWVEMGDLVLDDQMSHGDRPDGIPKDVYYDMYQPEVTAEFTAEEALTKCTMSGYEGPWDEESLGSMRQRDAWLNDGLIRENVDISINGVPLNVEFARDNRSRTQGLMYRSSLDKDTGMLFAFPEQDKRSFWMKDTPVPLSIAYIDVKNKIINIEDMEPYSEVGIKSVSPAMYALEMNGGWFGRNGIKPGDAVYGLQGLTCESHKILKSLIRENYRQIQLVEALTLKEMLNESVEFREVDSPLEYGRSGNVKRIALCDSSVTEPPGKHDSYFAEIEKWRKYTKGGRKLKKPKLDEIIPGVSDVCIVGFLDYHQKAKLESGVTFWYIDYMKTRSDMRGQGSASQLVEKFYETIPQSGDYVNFGKMMQPQVGHLKDKMAEKYPEIKTKGAEYF